MQRVISPVLCIAALLAGCGGGKPSETASKAAHIDQQALDQEVVCRVTALDQATATCKPGQKIIFLPESWGNAQLPVVFAGVISVSVHGVAVSNAG